MLDPQNEHHIVPTKLLAVLLVVNHGIWSPLLEMASNALLRVAAITLLLASLNRMLPPRQQGMLLVAGALLFSLPFGWEDALWGFQSQFYFLLLFSLLFLRAIAQERTGSGRWWLGMVSGVLATMSLASGLIALMAGALLLALRQLQGSDRSHTGRASIALLLLGAALAYRWIPPVAAVVSFEPSPASTYHWLWAILAWPFPAYSALFNITLLQVFCVYLLPPSNRPALRVALALAMLFLLLRVAMPSPIPDMTVLLLLPMTGLALLPLAAPPQRYALAALSGLWFLLSMDWTLMEPGAGAVLYLPLWLFTAARLARPAASADASDFALILGFWLAGQYLSISEGRSFGYAASRYRDLYLVGLLLNMALVLRWLAQRPATLPGRLRIIPLAWLAALVLGLASATPACLHELARKYQQSQAQAANVSAYLRTGNPVWLRKRPVDELPAPSADDLQAQLDRPAQRAMMAPELLPANAARQAAWVSVGLAHLAVVAVLARIAGLLLGVVVAVRSWPATRRRPGQGLM